MALVDRKPQKNEVVGVSRALEATRVWIIYGLNQLY